MHSNTLIHLMDLHLYSCMKLNLSALSSCCHQNGTSFFLYPEKSLLSALLITFIQWLFIFLKWILNLENLTIRNCVSLFSRSLHLNSYYYSMAFFLAGCHFICFLKILVIPENNLLFEVAIWIVVLYWRNELNFKLTC